MRALVAEKGLVLYLLNGVTKNKGWGNEPGEFKESNPLNTAEVIYGLLSVRHQLSAEILPNDFDLIIQNGIDYLFETQLSSGGWATGSAYLQSNTQAKGNIVSTVWSIWALYEYTRRYNLNDVSKEKIILAFRDSCKFLSNRFEGLWTYHPDVKLVNPMASTYGLLGLSFLLKSDELINWNQFNKKTLKDSLFESLSTFEAEYIQNKFIFDENKSINIIIMSILIITLNNLLECQNFKIIKSKLIALRKDIWENLAKYPVELLRKCVIEEQAVIEPGKIRDFIHYTPVWVLIAIYSSKGEIFYSNIQSLLHPIFDNIDENYQGASYGEAKRHTWSTALTLMVIGSVIDNLDFDEVLLNIPKEEEKTMADPSKIFVVHGRNEQIRRAMFEFLRSLNMQPIEWDEAIRLTGSSSPYIGDIIKQAFNVAQAILVIFTGDDEGRLRVQFQKSKDPSYEKKLTPQPRMNVIFEAGMAWSQFPTRTILVEIGKCKPFSDISGVHTVRFNGTASDRQSLVNRLEIAGCKVNQKGRDWLEAGNFKVS